MKKINAYLIMIIGNYLEIQDVVRLSATCKKCNAVFSEYFEFYKRECKRLFLSNCYMFKNLLMSSKASSTKLIPESETIFLCKGTATKIWRDLVLEGMSLKYNWSKAKFTNNTFNFEVLKYLGECLFDILRTPDLPIPALIKEDANVDFHSVYSTYLYEYLFRMNSIYKGKKPAATFTILSEREQVQSN